MWIEHFPISPAFRKSWTYCICGLYNLFVSKLNVSRRNIGVDTWLYHSYTESMKTAISLPDELFVLADDFAKSKGMSRSELYAAAIRDYIENDAKADLVARINAVCEKVDTSLPKDIATVTRQKLLEAEW